MKIGATAAYTYAWKGTGMQLKDYLESIRSLSAMGIKCFDLEILNEKHIGIYSRKKHMELLKATCAETGVAIVGFTAWVCVKYLHSVDQKKRAKAFELFSMISGLASEFGAEYIHIGSDMIQEYIVARDATYASAPPVEIAVPADTSYSQVVDQYAADLDKMARIAGQHNLKLSLEMRANAVVNSADSFLEVARKARNNNLYCCLDIIHCAYHREDIPIAIEKLGKKLLVVQLCDSISGDLTHYPVGKGQVKFDPIFAALQKTNFDGFLMLEIYKGGRDSKKNADLWYSRAYEKIKKRFQPRQGACL